MKAARQKIQAPTIYRKRRRLIHDKDVHSIAISKYQLYFILPCIALRVLYHFAL